MDSLFDASFFDTAPVAKPAEKPAAIVGQLDIFGNVVELGDVASAVIEAGSDAEGPSDAGEDVAQEIDPLEAAELAGELPGAPIVVDPLEPTDSDDLDPGNVLNDPTWEPNEPIDLDEIVAAFEEPVDTPEVPLVEVADEVPGASQAVDSGHVPAESEIAETNLFGEPISPVAAEQEVVAPGGPEMDLFGEPITQTLAPQELPSVHVDAVDAANLATVANLARAPLARPVTEIVADQVGADGRRNRSVDALWDLVIGQGSTVETLRSAAQQPVHAYLFVGPPGAGKVRAALAFAASVLCPRGGCGECDICSRTLNQTHPDLLNVEREGASISVDQAREIIRLALRSPVEGSRKVLVLNDFHLVTNAGPTLLKIIEEPPPSTIFLVLAEQVTNELVTIASRCVQMSFAPLSVGAVVEALMASGIEESVAKTAANAAGGRLDRARLLATDPEVANRMAFWQNIPRRLDGTGAAASVVAAEAVGMVDAAAVGPLEARQAEEVAALDARLELIGGKGGAGQRKELQERHKRELKRLRDDEIRFGLAALAQAYRAILLAPEAGSGDQRKAIAATTRVATASEHLIRNPNINLLLAALFVDLSPDRR